jgi:hypothetical protein
MGLVEVFLTNGNGVAWHAESVYKAMLNQFDADQALIAILSFADQTIASRLQFSLCQQKYRELLDILKVKVTAEVARELVEDIQAYQGPLDRMKDDDRIKRKVNNLKKILS